MKRWYSDRYDLPGRAPTHRRRGARGSMFAAGLIAACATWIVAGAPGAGAAAESVWLVTAEEAALPDPPLRGPQKDLNAGPEIRVTSPANDSVVEGEFAIAVSFHVGVSGRDVDLSTLQVTYRKAWGIDITSRLTKYISFEKNRIDVPDARLPRGRHSIEIYVEDIDSNASSRVFSVQVDS